MRIVPRFSYIRYTTAHPTSSFVSKSVVVFFGFIADSMTESHSQLLEKGLIRLILLFHKLFEIPGSPYENIFIKSSKLL